MDNRIFIGVTSAAAMLGSICLSYYLGQKDEQKRSKIKENLMYNRGRYDGALMLGATLEETSSTVDWGDEQTNKEFKERWQDAKKQLKERGLYDEFEEMLKSERS